MIIRNNQTIGGLKRLGFLVALFFSLSTMAFRTRDNVAEGFPEIYQYGKASYYAGQFIGRKTANGEIFNVHEFTCAHKTLPFGTKLKITNLATNESIIVRVNDRGPYVKSRVVDLSLAGAKELGLLQSGIANVSVEIVNKQFSSLGNTKNMERIYVDNQFAYIRNSDDKTFEKLYTYLTETLQMIEKEEKKLTPAEVKSEPNLELPSQSFADSMGTSTLENSLVVED